MTHLIRLVLAAFGLALLAAPAGAVSTTRYTITSGAWSDLGAGPLRLQLLTQASDLVVCVADAQPAADAQCFVVAIFDQTQKDFPTSSHVWAKGRTGATSISVAPISGASGGDSSAANQVIANTDLGAPADAPWSGSGSGAVSPVLKYIGAKDEAIRALLAGTLKVDGSAVTQPVSAASLPLPAGAATAANQPALNADGGALAHVTNFPATQPVSAASLPLPTGAAQETGGNLATLAARTPALGQATMANSRPVVIASDQSVNVMAPDVRGTGTLNSATSNAAYSVAINNGEGTTSFAVTGLTASGATLGIEASDDGGTTWAAVNGIAPGTGVLFSTLTADQQFRVNSGGRTNVRLRVSATGTGTITIASNASSASSAVAMSSPLPAGTNLIGKCGIDQTTPGTTNAVSDQGVVNAINAAALTPPIAVTGTTSADGSTTITLGGTAQNLFAGATPTNGWEVCNPDTTEDLWVSDSTTALANGAGSYRVVLGGGCYGLPFGSKPLGAVSVVAATTGHKITARKW